MKLYPQTKVVFTSYPNSETLHFRRSCGSITLSGEGISPETSPCAYQITDCFVDGPNNNLMCGKIISVCFRAPAPHLDYFQDDEARLEFHKTFPLIKPELSERNVSEGHVLTGHYDTEDLKVGVMLGVWKPLHPTQVKLLTFMIKTL